MPYTYQPSGANYCFYHEDGYPVCVGDGKKPSQKNNRFQKPHGVPILLKIKDKPNPELKKAAAERKKEYDRLYRASKREYKTPRKKTAEELGAFPYSREGREKKEKEEKRYAAKLALKEKKAEAKKKLDALKKTNDNITKVREKKDDKEKQLAITKYESKWENSEYVKRMEKLKKGKSEAAKKKYEKLKEGVEEAKEKHKEIKTKSIKVLEADIDALEKKELKAIGVDEIKKQKAKQKEKEEDATITIQTAVRRFKAKKKVKQIREKDTAKKKKRKEKADRFNTKYLEPVKKLLEEAKDIKYDTVRELIDDSVVRDLLKNKEYVDAFVDGAGGIGVWNYYEGGKTKSLNPKEVMSLAKDEIEKLIKKVKEDEEFLKKREEDEKKRQAEIKRVKALSSQEYADEQQKKKMKKIIDESEKRLEKLEKRIKKHIADGNKDRAKDYEKMIKIEKEKLEKLKKL